MSYPGYYNLDQFIDSNSNSPYLEPSQNISLSSLPVQNDAGSRSYTPEPTILPSSSVSSSNTDMPKPSSSSASSSTTKKRQVPVTNKHTQPQDFTKINKKRKSNVRACDACAARKIKCAEKRPCKKCIESGIECTFNREIKKSGPKTVRPATIQRINTYQTINDITRGIDSNEAVNETNLLSSNNDSGNTQNVDVKIENSSINSTPSITSNAGSAITVINNTSNKHRNKKVIDNENNSPAKDLVSEAENPPPLATQIQASNSQPPRTTASHSATNSNNNNNYGTTVTTTNNNNNTGINYRPTPSNLIENIRLIGEEPIIRELIQPLTVQSLILNYGKLIDFLNANFANYFNSPINPMNQEINLTSHHDDSLYLSQILIILTINLIIAEILIKFKKRKFKNFIKYPKKNLETRNFKNFKNLCHFKCIEIYSYIEINLIVPPIIPQNAFKAANNNATASSGGSNVNNSNNGNNNSTENNNVSNNPNTHNLCNLHQVFYNLSLSSLHLCNYYHTLNLTNTLNTIPVTATASSGGVPSAANSSSASPINANINHHIYAKDGNYGNEIQEYQKVLNLNRSITYFQLINIKNNTDSSLVIKLSELFEMIFTFERYYLLFSSFNYNLNRFRNNDIIIQLNCKKIMKYKQESINNTYNANQLFQLLNILDEVDSGNSNDEEDNGGDIMMSSNDDDNSETNHFTKLCKNTSFNNKLKYIEDGSLSKYWGLKQRIMTLIPSKTEEEIGNENENLKVFEIIRYGVLFKLLLIYPVSFEELRLELYDLITRLNDYLRPSDSEIFKLKISNFQLLPHLLHLLKILLQVESIKTKIAKQSPHEQGSNFELTIDFEDEIRILMFSDNLSKHFTFFNNINKLIRSDGLLNNWYLNLNENRNRLVNSKNNQPTKSNSTINAPRNNNNNNKNINNTATANNNSINQSNSTNQFIANNDGKEFSIDDIIADFSSTMVNGNSGNARPPIGLNRLSTTTTTTTNGTSTPEDEDPFTIQPQFNSFQYSPQFTPSSIYNSYQNVSNVVPNNYQHLQQVQPQHQPPHQASRLHSSTTRPHINGSNSSSSITESSTTSSIISGSNAIIQNQQGLGLPVPPVVTAFTATEDNTIPVNTINNTTNNSNNVSEQFITGLTPASPSGAAIKLTKSATTLFQHFASSNSLSNLFGFGSGGSPPNTSNLVNTNSGDKLEENSDQFSF